MLLVAVLALSAANASSAYAEYRGTPGKIAYLDGSKGTSSQFPLELWDPAVATPSEPNKGIQTVIPSTFHYAGGNEVVKGQPSTPVFSPDGTQIAFSKLEPDPGWPHVKGYHTAIWVINANGSGERRLTNPVEAEIPPPECKQPCRGHYEDDYSPTWSPDGKTIAFIRQVEAGEADSLYGARGEDIWTVPAAGGTPTQLTTGETRLFQSVVWGTKGMVAAYFDVGAGKEELGVLHGGGSPSVIAEPEVIEDYDVSPDGEHVVYTTLSTSGKGSDEYIVGIDGSGEELLSESLDSPLVRYSNTGNGPLHPDCNQINEPGRSGTRCGIFEEHTPETEGPNEPGDRFALAWTDSGGAGARDLGFTRGLWDVQAQQLPVVFVPGFLGSEIRACGSKAWFGKGHLGEISLEPDGVTNNPVCPDAGPSGELISPFAYGGIESWIKSQFGAGNTLFGCERANIFGWDWRKAPQASLAALEAKITEALSHDKCAKEEGASRVVIMAHSYGGLLTRTFVNSPERAQRVARVLTVGTPYWGAPKSIFPPAYGIEMPDSFLNWFFNEEELKLFSHNLAGLMQLFPSSNFGPWLTFNGGAAQGGKQVASFLGHLGVTTGLFEAAQQNHESIYDSFNTNEGLIDYRLVVGTGLLTPVGIAINGLVGGNAEVTMQFGNGDETVPATSANTGKVGSQPNVTGVHVQYIKGVGHMAEAESSPVEHDYEAFLDYGHIPLKTEGAGTVSGSLLRVAPGTLGPGIARPLDDALRPAVKGPGEALSLEEAGEAGELQLFKFPGEEQALFDDSRPVKIEEEANGVSFTITQLTEAGPQQTISYGPLTGRLRIEPSEAGEQVLLEGVPVTGTVIEGPGSESAGGGGQPGGGVQPGGGGQPGGAQPGGGGGGGEGASGGGGVSTGSTGAGNASSGGSPGGGGGGGGASAYPASATFRVTSVHADRHGNITVALVAPGPGVFRARASAKLQVRSAHARHKKTTTVAWGSASATASRAGSIQLKIHASRAGLHLLSSLRHLSVVVAITFSATGGASHSALKHVTIASGAASNHATRR